MSTQSTSAIPFTFTNPQQPFRLLELPPEILQLLRSDTPPTLKLKSSALEPTTPLPKLSSNGVSRYASTAHLVTPTKSYQIRQVSTSNSVFISQPSLTISKSRSDDDHVLGNVTATSMTAISTVDSVLELHPVSYPAEEELTKVLPVWSPEFGLYPSAVHRTKENHFTEIPLPEGQLNIAYLNLLGFPLKNEGVSVRPSAPFALKVWKDILTVAIETSTDLSSFFYPSAILSASDQESETTDSEGLSLKSALLHYLTYVQSPNDALPLGVEAFNPDEKVWIQKPKLLLWTGATLLSFLIHSTAAEEDLPSSLQQTPSIPTDSYLAQWHDLLPEPWRQSATLSLLSPLIIEDNGTLKLSTTFSSSSSSTQLPLYLSQSLSSVALTSDLNTTSAAATSKATGSTTMTTTAAAAGTDKKRKWHEKFKAERDARVAAAAAKAAKTR